MLNFKRNEQGEMGNVLGDVEQLVEPCSKRSKRQYHHHAKCAIRRHTQLHLCLLELVCDIPNNVGVDPHGSMDGGAGENTAAGPAVQDVELFIALAEEECERCVFGTE